MMKRCFLSLALLFTFAFANHSLQAQASATATRGGALQVGVGYSNGQTDEFKRRVDGGTAYATFDITQRLGLEADIHLLTRRTPDDFLEKSYLVGGRYVYRKRLFEPYAKVLFGIGQTSLDRAFITAPGTPGTYGIYAFGGGLDLRLAHRINVRAIDYESQHWSGFPPNGLTPSMFTVGVAYRVR